MSCSIILCQYGLESPTQDLARVLSLSEMGAGRLAEAGLRFYLGATWLRLPERLFRLNKLWLFK